MRAGVGWGETRRRMAEDRLRLLTSLARDDARRGLPLICHPAHLCTVLHRMSHYFSCRGHRFVARLLWHLNVVLTGADIHPAADIGGGLLIPYPASISIAGNAGRNLTVMALSGIGGELNDQSDIGAGPGLPILGDDVYMAPHTGILGPIRVGHRVRIEAGSILTCPVPDGAQVTSAPVRSLRTATGGGEGHQNGSRSGGEERNRS